jgi:hypothetical protein
MLSWLVVRRIQYSSQPPIVDHQTKMNMSFFKRLFQKSQPIEPIFPGESFSILKINMPDGLAFATVNKAYDNYRNKGFYPWLAGVEIQIIEMNQNGHPTNPEGDRINQIQVEFEAFLKQKHTIHSVARVTRKGFRDLFIYTNTPKLTQDEVTIFFEGILKEREVNFSFQADPHWKAVSGFIK